MKRFYQTLTLIAFIGILCITFYSTNLLATPLYPTIDIISVTADGIDTQSSNISCGVYLSRAQLWVTWGSDGTSRYYESKDFIKPQPNICNVLVGDVEFPRGYNNTLHIIITAYNDEGQLIRGEKEVTVAGSWWGNRYDEFGYIELDVPSSNTVPDTPTLQSPINNVSVTPNTDTTLRWNSSARATEYFFELWHNESGNVIKPSGHIADTSRNVGRLQPGTYWWQVYAANSSGNSPWSNKGYFSVSAPLAAPDKPSLLSPTNGATVSSEADIVLEWSKAARATEYAVELITPSGTRQSGRIGSTYWNTGRLQPGSYTWYAEAYSPGHWSGWTDEYNFTVGVLRKVYMPIVASN